MTTIILRKNKDGVITGRCDARCYEAKGKKFYCVCGGSLHGKGLNEAILSIELLQRSLNGFYKDDELIFKQGQLQLFEEVKQ